MQKALIIVAGVLLLSACSTRQPAPVAERPLKDASRSNPPPTTPTPVPARPEAAPKEKVHVVQRGETLIAIALQYGLDYKDLAGWNNIENVNLIHAGQEIRLGPVVALQPTSATAGTGVVATPMASASAPVARPIDAPANTPAGTVPGSPTVPGSSPVDAGTPGVKTDPKAIKLPYSDKALAELEAEAKSASAASAASATTTPGTPASPAVPAPTAPAQATPATDDKAEKVDWSWPAKGRILAPFTEASRGIDIAGTTGSPVLAAADGKVMYSGTGIRGYGKLVILKHSNVFLSAYAHNSNIVVKEGQDVKRGQKIAEMGATDTDQVKLHFEIRKQGKPVDPAKILPAQ